MKKILSTFAMLAVAGIVLAGCATPEAGSPESIALMKQQQLEAKVDAMEDAVYDTPDWYSEIPKSDTAVFVTARGASADMQFAYNMATLQAQNNLAKQINAIVSSRIKSFQTDVGDAASSDFITEREEVIDSVVAEVSVTGYNIADTDVQAGYDGRYVVYVLLEYPLGEANRLLVDRIKQNRKLYAQARANEAFKELEAKVEEQRSLGNTDVGTGTGAN